MTSMPFRSTIGSWKKRLQNSHHGKKLATHAIWSLSGAVIAKSMTFVSTIIIARMLGITRYGEYGVIQSTINMFGIFAGLGLGVTATKYIAQYKETDKVKVGKIVALIETVALVSCLSVSLLFFLFASPLASSTLNAPHLTNTLRITSLFLFFWTYTGLQNGILAGYEAFRTIAITTVASGAAALFLIVGGSYLYGLDGTITGLTCGSMINVGLNFFAIRRLNARHGIRIETRGCWSERKVLHQFAIPAFLAGLMVAPATWVCNSILIHQPNGYVQMGIYSAAYQWMMVILFIPMSVSPIVLPMLISLNRNSETRQYLRVLAYNALLAVVITSTVALGVLVFSEQIMSLFGRSFTGGGGVLTMLSMAAILNAYNNVIGQALASKGKMWIGFSINMVWAAVLISLTYLFTSLGQGAMGLAKAYFTAYFVLSGLTSIIIFAYFRNRNAGAATEPALQSDEIQ